MTGSTAERYLKLGLQLRRHVDGIVDAYYGPPELAATVEAEPPVNPQALVSAAEALLVELEDGWLRDQVVGVRTYAGVLAGEARSYADEVEGCYGVRPAARLPAELDGGDRAHLPLTHGIEAARDVVGGASLASVLDLVWTELAIGAAYGAAGYRLFRFFEVEGRRRASLEVI